MEQEARVNEDEGAADGTVRAGEGGEGGTVDAGAGGTVEAGGGRPTPAQQTGAGGEAAAEVRERHAELSREIDEHQYRYYVLDAASVDDATYDRLMHELEGIEQRYPSLVTPESPS